MKALSIKQPWAWLIVNGFKDVENRTWTMHYKGPLLIHAGKRLDIPGYKWVKKEHPEIPLPSREDLKYGGVIGVADFIGTTRFSTSSWAQDGLIHFILSNAKPLPFFECRGQLGIFNPDLDKCSEDLYNSLIKKGRD